MLSCRLFSSKLRTGQCRARSQRIVTGYLPRGFGTTYSVRHGEKEPEDENVPKYTVNWILRDGTKLATKEREGLHLLEIAHKNGIDLEGACEASLACSTCHVIVDEDVYEMLPEPEDEENDMLDLAFGLTSTSRLGCQVYLTKEIDGITVKIPQATRNMAVDGFVPKPH